MGKSHGSEAARLTLPSQKVFPFNIENFPTLDEEAQLIQWKEKISSLHEMYEDIVQVVNGDMTYIGFDSADQSQVIPLISGTTSKGIGTYSDREIWRLRQGLLCHIWFDISWTAHTGTGNIYVDLPWEVALTSYDPFIGTIESDNINLTSTYSWLTINCQSSTFKGNIIRSGDSITSSPLPMQTSGRLKGYVKYIGKQIQ